MDNLTKRQYEALEAVLEGKQPTYRKVLYSSGPQWQHTSSMGGAARRMVQTLQDGGYLTGDDPRDWRTRDAKGLKHRPRNQLTVKGLRALEAHLGESDDLSKRIAARAEVERLEAEEDERLAQEERAEREASRSQRDAQTIVDLRQFITDERLGGDWTSLSDDQLLRLAKIVRGY